MIPMVLLLQNLQPNLMKENRLRKFSKYFKNVNKMTLSSKNIETRTSESKDSAY